MDYKDVSNINWNRHYTNNINKILNDTISDISENSEIQYEGEINFHSYTILQYIRLKENLENVELENNNNQFKFNSNEGGNVIFTSKDEFKMNDEIAKEIGITNNNDIYYIGGMYIQKEEEEQK